MSGQALHVMEEPAAKPPYPLKQTQWSGIGVVITDPFSRIRYVNRAFTNITGYSLQDVKGKNPRILQSGYHDEAFYQKMWSTLDTTGQWRGQVIDRRKDDSVYLEQLHIISMKNDRNEIMGYIGIISDISEFHEPECQLYYIEELREQLYALSMAKGLLDKEVIEVSQKLDKLLNGYHHSAYLDK